MNRGRWWLVLLCVLVSHAAWAQIKVGVTLSLTGPAASLGIPERDTIALLPKEIAGQKIAYIVLDDASDTTTSVKNAKKLVSEENRRHLGPSLTPTTLALLDVIAKAGRRPSHGFVRTHHHAHGRQARMDVQTPQTDVQMASRHGACRRAWTEAHRLLQPGRHHGRGITRKWRGRHSARHPDGGQRAFQPARYQRDRQVLKIMVAAF